MQVFAMWYFFFTKILSEMQIAKQYFYVKALIGNIYVI